MWLKYELNIVKLYLHKNQYKINDNESLTCYLLDNSCINYSNSLFNEIVSDKQKMSLTGKLTAVALSGLRK